MGLLNELFSGLGKGIAADASFTLGPGVSEGACRSIWAKYVAYRQAGYLTPFSVRKAPYKQKMFSIGSHIIKEYTGARETVEKEVSILQQLNHPNLVGFMFIADQGSRISLVMDWAGVNLREHRTITQAHQYTEDVVRHMMYQLTSALVYLHQKGIIHRDIKPDNIAVQRDHTVQLFDWGEALSLGQLRTLNDRELARQAGVAGTPLFMPPEVLNYITDRDRDDEGAHTLRRIITTKLDVWGLGTVLYFLLAGRDIFMADDSWELENLADIASASTGVELPEGVEVSFAARDFLRCCLQRDPARRASAKELAEHPWLFGARTYADMCAASEAAAAAAAVAALDQSTAASFRTPLGGLPGPPGAGCDPIPSSRPSSGRPVQLSVLAESCSSDGEEGAAVPASDALTASLALASGVAGFSLGGGAPAGQALQEQQQQQQAAAAAATALAAQRSAQLRRRGSHQRLDSYGSCKSLVAAEEEAAAALAAAELRKAANGEAVCEVRLKLSPSTASLASAGSLVTSAA